MSSFHVYWPDAHEVERAELNALVQQYRLPVPYWSQSATAQHFKSAIFWTAIELDATHFVRANGGVPIDLRAYYSSASGIDARCSKHDDIYVVVFGLPFLRRLVKICHRLGPVLNRRPRDYTSAVHLETRRDPVLRRILFDELAVSNAEADKIMNAWPPAFTEFADIGLGEFTLFYDLVRLVWLHEWAHVICGHTGVALGDLGLTELGEAPKMRSAAVQGDVLGLPHNLVMQSLELHADWYAIRGCVHDILLGRDPAGTMAAQANDIVDRLLFLNVACTIFAVLWSMSDERFDLRPFLEYGHPPASLRYLRFRTFQRQKVAEKLRNAAFVNKHLDDLSMCLVQMLAYACDEFECLLGITPTRMGDTPAMLRLDAYENRVTVIGKAMWHLLDKWKFEPSRDPYLDPIPWPPKN